MKPGKALILKKFISILLVLLLISSFVLLSGCRSGAFNPEPGDEIEDPEDSEEEEDEILEVIKNGKFDKYNDPTTTAFPVIPKNWSSATGDSYGGQNAPAVSGTDVRYGAISIKDEHYDADPEKFKTDSMKKGANKPLDNPGYPQELIDDGDENDKIFMLENIKETATKTRTSSSISVPVNSYAIISVWVNTVLIDKDGEPLAGLEPGQGATISITGGVDKPVILYGIDTKGDWKEYQFLIEGSSVSSKSITLELGLGTGSPLNTEGYTEGFAFFANAVMTYITQKEFNEKKNAADNDNDVEFDSFAFGEINYGRHECEKQDFAKDTVIAYSFKNSANTASGLDSFDVHKIIKDDNNPLTNEDSIISDTYTGSDFTVYNNTSFNSISSEKIKNDLKEENFPFANSNITVLQKNSDAKTSVGIVKEDFLTVKEGDYYKISFWAKTSDITRGGLNAYLINTSYSAGYFLPEANYKNFLNINTTAYKLTLEEKEKVTNADTYDDWRQYSFYVDGGIFERNQTETTLALEIWFGSINLNYEIDNLGNANAIRKIDDKLYKDSTNFPEKDSYALIADIEVEKLYRSVYSSASSGDNSVTGFSLSNRYGSNSLTNGSFNNSTASDTLVTDRPLSPANFTGSYRPGAVQDSVLSGIINTNLHSAAPWLNPYLSATGFLDALKRGDTWNSLLMIYNQSATAYGYASDKISLNANSYYEISVSVKTMGTATANIYLVDSDGNILGNYILDKYGEKKISGLDLTKDKALVYNPFYEEKYDKTLTDKYKQDLEYENSDENKLLRKGTKDVVASTIPVANPFYIEDYDANKDKTNDPQWKKDLKPIKYFMYASSSYCSGLDITEPNLFKRIDIDYSDKAEFKITATGNDFVTYTFFIKTGNTARNVTLELWNGSKYSNDDSEGAVFFDTAIKTTPTNAKEIFYEYALYGEIYGETVGNAKFFDMSGYDNIPDPKVSTVDPTETPGDDEHTPFNWINLIYILPTSAMVIALAIVVVRKLTKNKKAAEEIVTEKPTYARGKTSKKSVDKDDAK